MSPEKNKTRKKNAYFTSKNCNTTENSENTQTFNLQLELQMNLNTLPKSAILVLEKEPMLTDIHSKYL